MAAVEFPYNWAMETAPSIAAAMPRKFFKKYLPDHESVRKHRHIARFGGFLRHPNLWHLNRHSVAGGVAVGMFSGLIPGPLQMLGAAIVLCSPGIPMLFMGQEMLATAQFADNAVIKATEVLVDKS